MAINLPAVIYLDTRAQNPAKKEKVTHFYSKYSSHWIFIPVTSLDILHEAFTVLALHFSGSQALKM